MAPTDYRQYKYPFEANQLAALNGGADDLFVAKSYLDELAPDGEFDILNRSTAQRTTDQALIEAAVVRYGRLFGSGGRRTAAPWADMVAELPEELRGFHEFIKDLRDKHVAHSISQWEQNNVSVLVAVHADGSRVIQSVSSQSLRVVPLNRDMIVEFRRLIDALHEVVRRRMDEERSVLLARVREVDPTTLEDIEYVHPPAEVWRSRP